MLNKDLERFEARLVELRDEALANAKRYAHTRDQYQSEAGAYLQAIHALYCYSHGRHGEHADKQPNPWAKPEPAVGGSSC